MSAFIEMLVGVMPVITPTTAILGFGIAYKRKRRNRRALITSRPKEATRLKSDVLRECAQRAFEESLEEDIQIILLKDRLGLW